MGFFNLFSGNSSKESSSFDWLLLHTISQIDSIVEVSDTKTQLIFKHSTRCGISSGVIKKFEKKFEDKNKQVDFYYLDLIANRDISNTISERFDTAHQSPQVLIVKNGKVIAHASHYDILSLDF